jgi:hypothetical protein
MTRKSIVSTVGAVLASGALIIGTAGAAGSARDFHQPSGIEKAPRVSASGDVAAKVTELARLARTDPEAALADLRLVQTNAGSANADIYGFLAEGGHPCVVVPDVIGFCEPATGPVMPGFDWSLGGGDAVTPSRLIGVYSDDVTAVRLVVDGTSVPVSLAMSVAYAEFSGDAEQAEITVARSSGASSTATVDLKG